MPETVTVPVDRIDRRVTALALLDLAADFLSPTERRVVLGLRTILLTSPDAHDHIADEWQAIGEWAGEAEMAERAADAEQMERAA